MRLNFNDKHMVLKYLQIKLNETYDPNIIINNQYYTSSNINFGFAHYIANYLNTQFPYCIDSDMEINLPNTMAQINQLFNNELNKKEPVSLSNPISLENYFLCNNEGEKLTENNNIYTEEIYNESIINLYKNTGTLLTCNNLKKLEKWNKDKSICELDDFILSYLIGKTITKYSTRDEIYYVQKLLINTNYITKEQKGIWHSVNDDPETDLTYLILKYQKLYQNLNYDKPLFITGYFDIFTEAIVLKEQGKDNYHGLYGL